MDASEYIDGLWPVVSADMVVPETILPTAEDVNTKREVKKKFHARWGEVAPHEEVLDDKRESCEVTAEGTSENGLNSGGPGAGWSG